MRETFGGHPITFTAYRDEKVTQTPVEMRDVLVKSFSSIVLPHVNIPSSSGGGKVESSGTPQSTARKFIFLENTIFVKKHYAVTPKRNKFMYVVQVKKKNIFCLNFYIFGKTLDHY